MLQKVNAETQIPYCNLTLSSNLATRDSSRSKAFLALHSLLDWFSASYVVLDKDSTVKLWDLVNKAGFASVASGSDKVLGHGADDTSTGSAQGKDGVFAWVHSRYDGGKTKVSTQLPIGFQSRDSG